MKKYLFLLIFAFSLGCSKKKPEPTVERDYIKAYELLTKDKSYAEAAKAFEELEDDYPFSKWASKAQSMAAYAYFKNEDYDDVVRVVDDFIRINPVDDRIDYMLYLKAMSYYVQIPSISRAQDPTKESSMVFRELKARYPQSDYAMDARRKLLVVDEHLAGALMSVGRYEAKNSNYVGALKNFDEVARRYQGTNQLPEAYYRLMVIYYRLGLVSEARKVYAKLLMRFGDNVWAGKAKKVF